MKDRNHSKSQKQSVSKEDFCRFSHLLYDRYLVSGSGGNLSVRVGEKIFVTPSACSLRDMEPSMVVAMDMDGGVLEGAMPTKDVELHLGILRERADIHVVSHVHGAYIVAVSTLIDPGPDVLPPLTPGFVYFVHPLAMIPFMIPGTGALSEATIEQFRNPECFALLLRNHGLVTVGRNFQEALNLAEEVEEVARIYLLTNGKARPIPEEEVREIKKLKP
ncbi:MAG: class II aldolase/adducin family protein [Desulfobacteraceae bacterium]|jgi:ribulose-5-phosphate 4-epimerase/fuculose-1-phosphate aldolase